MTNNVELPDKVSFQAARAEIRKLMGETLTQNRGGTAEVTNYLADAAGKGFRSLLLLAASQDEAGNVPREAIPAAAAVEIMHLATLLHDDVIDDADTRRGRPSVQKKFGKKTAVICGDYLFCQCFLLVAGIAAPFQNRFPDMAKCVTRICDGEMRQLGSNWNLALTPMEYLRIAAGKTSAMFAFAAYAGSVLGGFGEEDAKRLGRFGYYVGMAFQLDDDCLDYASDTGTIKKNAQNDLAEGVITLPLIYAMFKEPELKGLLDRKTISAGAVGEIIGRVSQLGGVEETKEIARRYRLKAEKTLTRLPDGLRRRSLDTFLREIGGRKF